MLSVTTPSTRFNEIKNRAMKIIKLVTLLILFSLQAGASGYSHNMFVAHKKLQAGKECKTVNEQVASKKAGSVKADVKVSPAARPQSDNSFTRQFANKLSGMVTLNQRVLEQGPASFFETEDDEQEAGESVVSKLAITVKSLVFAFIGSTAFGKS